jgi:AcrR family transcriptional regulator
MAMEREERADAARNRRAILEAADHLFATSNSPGEVSMDDIARAAGVGKGTLFRRFGDRANLIRQVYAVRLAPLREQIESGPPPLGPDTVSPPSSTPSPSSSSTTPI